MNAETAGLQALPAQPRYVRFRDQNANTPSADPSNATELGSGTALVALTETLSRPLVLSLLGSPLRKSMVVVDPVAVKEVVNISHV